MLAVSGEPAAFMSYVHFDNEHNDGQLSEFRRLLSAEVQAQTGQEFVIFQDRAHISWGQNWQRRIDEALDVVTLLLVIVTPGFFSSTACRAEVARFLERERELGRPDLILPLYYITAREIEDPVTRESAGPSVRAVHLTHGPQGHRAAGIPDAGQLLAARFRRGSSRGRARAAGRGGGRSGPAGRCATGWRGGSGPGGSVVDRGDDPGSAHDDGQLGAGQGGLRGTLAALPPRAGGGGRG
jgi:hypothetical protein